MIIRKFPFFSAALGIFSIFLFASPAFAHVIIHPSSVGVASYQEFTMSVPTEKDNPTVALKLLIPDGLENVTPNVKPGWTITEKKNGSGEGAKVTEIDWTDGSIPVEQRDDFLFQAQVPSTPTTMKWKVYQTYEDGSVVSWDHAPGADSDDDSASPYSTTQVINDLTANTTTASVNSSAQTTQIAEFLSGLAVILSAAALFFSLKRRK